MQMAVLPVSAHASALTFAGLHEAFNLCGIQESQLLLAIVAEDGTIAFSEMHRGLHTPSF